MQQRENKNNNNSEPLGICQRLFNFVMDTLFRTRGRLPNPPAPRSIEVPVEGPSSVFWLEPEYYRGNSNSEIKVEVKHANGSENRGAKNDKATGEKVAGINGRGGEKEKNKNKDKTTLTEAAVAGGEAENRSIILPFIEGDINGRAEQFIKEQKIEFLSRSSTLEQPKSK